TRPFPGSSPRPSSVCSPLALHDALPICKNSDGPAPDGEEFFAMSLFFAANRWGSGEGVLDYASWARRILHTCVHKGEEAGSGFRSEEHTSELQSRFDLVCRLLLAKKKK